jgi:N-acetylmuramoyl-L-alanine amidase
VILTRSDDRYLTLRQRVRIANRVSADLLLSIHTNATPTHHSRGFETFILTPEALDVDGRALRLGDGAPRLGVDDATARVLDDIERGIALPDAAAVALSIQEKMREVRGAESDRGIRQDSMHVLLGATMPAVLVEVGFIDHPTEGAELADPSTQRKIAGALAAAIAEHIRH